MAKARIKYLIVGILLIGLEVLIALYVHDAFVRPYVGDALVVIVLYCLVRAVWPTKYHLLPLAIFVFAAGVEGMQYLQLADKLGIKSPFFKILLGSTFDFKDIACYGVGCLLIGLYEGVKKYTEDTHKNNR